VNLATAPGSVARDDRAIAAGPILLVTYRQIGDFVRSHSLIRACRADGPERAIDMLTGDPAVELAEFMPEVRRTFGFSARHNRLDLAQRRALARRLRSEGYAAAIVLRRGSKAALIPFLARIPTRVGVGRALRYPLVNRSLPLPKSRDLDEMTAVAQRVFGFRDGSLPPPRLQADAGEVAAVRARSGLRTGDVIVALVPGASSDRRSWPIDSSAALIDRCLRRGWSVWLIGGPQDQPHADRLAERFHGVGNFTRGPLRDAVPRLAAADAVVAKDGGLLHVAAALDRPTIGLFGTTDAWAFAPINPRCRILTAGGSPRAGASARPAGRFVPAPLARIAVDAVFAELSAAIRAAA